MKTPYKLAWMPFGEDRYTLLENYTPSSIATAFLLISMGYSTLVLVLLFGFEDYRVPSKCRVPS
jgi:hypothetical protein